MRLLITHLPGWNPRLFTILCLMTSLVALSFVSDARADRDSCVQAHEQAQVERLEGHYIASRTALLTCAQRECPKLISDECTRWLGELDTMLPTVVFAAQGEQERDLNEVVISLNGRPLAHHSEGRALPIDPGVYAVRFEADGYLPLEQSLTIRDGEKSRLVRARLVPARSGGQGPQVLSQDELAPVDGRAQRLWLASYALGAAGAISFAITLGAAARGHHMQKHCNDDNCSDGYADHGKALYRAVNASAIAGGVLTVAALGTLWSALRRDARTGSESHARAPAQLEAAREQRASRFDLGGYADSRGATLTAWGRW